MRNIYRGKKVHSLLQRFLNASLKPVRRITPAFAWATILASLFILSPRVHGGSILRQVYQGITGTSVSELTGAAIYPDNPTSTNFVSNFFEAPVDTADNYGQRMHGYVVPPVTGNYTFWIASDDNGELWLSTDETPANQQLIARVTSWTSSREWTKEANQQSAPIFLEAGRAYYIAALQKEGGGGDNLAVRWLRPDAVDEGPIPGTHLLPFGTSFTPPIISQQPTNTTAIEGQIAQFIIKVQNLDLVSYQWFRNDIPIPGVTGSILNYGPVTLADHNSRFRVVLTNSLGSTNSTEAILSIVADTTKPTLVSALNFGPTTIRLIFSEPVAPPSATTSFNYTINRGVTVSGAAFGGDTRTITLTTSPLIYETNYTITVNNVADRAATPNVILANSTISFTAVGYVPQDIGSPAAAGGSVTVPGGFDVTGAGTGAGGATDQFHFSFQQRTGDFDLQVRVAGVTVTDPFLQAGLMARESLDANARFAAVFASSVQLGCHFASRDPAGANSTTASPVGGFPVNYPQTWLRLRRTGTTLTGFASLDAITWYQLGTRTLANLPATIFFGFAVASEKTGTPATAQFRDLATTTSLAAGTWQRRGEPLAPSSRRTGIVISEIMYHPPPRSDGRNLEYVELYNAQSIFEDLSGWRLSADTDFVFPNGYILQAGEFAVVATNPDDVKAVYGITNVLGPFALAPGDTNALPNDAGTVRLRNKSDAARLEVNYSDNPRWPAAADGAGHSLVLAAPSYGEDDSRAWAASQIIGGSPGGPDAVYANPQAGIVINEFLAHTDDPAVDFVELYNYSTQPVNLSGCILTDDPATNRYRIPNGTTLAARAYLAYDQNQLGFRLSAAGETIYLISSNGTRVLDALRFGPQQNGVASGRTPDGAPVIRRLAYATRGASNAPWRVEDIVINEIMFHPISENTDDEYVELHNRSAVPVNLAGWRFVDGVDFEFPANTTIPASGYVVVAKNAARLIANHAQLSTANTVGDYGGTLSDAGERLALAMPDTIVETNEFGVVITNLVHIVTTETTYGEGGRWSQWADGRGSSLELIDPRADPLRAASWADSDESQKAPWTQVTFTGRLDNGNTGYPPDRLHILMQGPGECLVDDVEIIPSGGANLVSNGGFESGTNGWSINGNHSTSSIQVGGAATGTQCLRVSAGGDGDTGVNSLRTPLAAGLAANVTATINAKVRWLKGWPEVLIRTRGNWIEMPARMTLPANLGTPGLSNSRRVSNAPPAIFDVNHSPAVPSANQAVVVTSRVSDPDGVASVNLRYRVDPSATLTTLAMRDDGAGGDAIAGDGIYSATISGRAAATLVAFRVEAVDAAAVTSVFPALAPAQECLIRWGDTNPSGNFAHYHLWSTAATESARTASPTALNNTWRDATLVYNNDRVIYNVGFRDKGSPWHGGGGDFAVAVPTDDRLLGATERVFASTGNGGSEATGLRGRLASWLHQQLGVPYLHAHYIRLYRNGGLHRNVSEDLEQPDSDYAESWFPSGLEGDLYKVALWFEFQDNNTTFNDVNATAERFLTVGNLYKPARYRWNFQRRPNDGTANNFTNLFDLVTAANSTSPSYVPNLLQLVDVEQWMRVFGCGWIMGDWDMWSYNKGQNMYVYKQPGARWGLMRWDTDFTFGLGDGATTRLWDGHDPAIDRMYGNPTFLRMLWRGYIDAVNGAMLPQNFQPQIDARRAALLANNITGLSDPSAITTFINQRRSYILGQINANNAAMFAITSNSGNDFTNATPAVILGGIAPFQVATILVNGVPYPVTWISQTGFQITIPLLQGNNLLTLVGLDRQGKAIAGATDTITVHFTGTPQQPQDYVVINEIQFDPAIANASFIELYNRSTTTPFDLSTFRLDGAAYTFPQGAIIQPSSHLLVVKDRAAFANAYGQTISVFDEFPGSLNNDGEYLALIKPGATPAQDLIISDVAYDSQLPWPTNAAGFGPSLQLVDAAQDEYRVGNWATAAVGNPNAATPGRTNTTRQTLPAFPLVWLNEVLPNPALGGISGLTDNAGDRDPWIEIYNSGNSAVDLSACYLTDNYTNLTRWQFPAGTSIGAKQFLIVWADGEPGESVAGVPHTSFRLNPTNGALALVRLQGSPSDAAVMDYLEYVQPPANRSVGSFPDGEPRNRRPFYYVTPAATNDATLPPLFVRINEVMAGNTTTLADGDGDFDDWFELYNAGSEVADLTGYTLTDVLTNSTKFTIPAGATIPPGGFLLVWADEEPGQYVPGSDLHADFRLALAGEEIGLFAPDGTLVDSVVFGQQTNDVSYGRFPDGGAAALVFLDAPTPRAPNFVASSNRLPVFVPIPPQGGNEGSPISFTVSATDPDAGQTISYSLGLNAPPGADIHPVSGVFTWSPGEAAGPGNYTFSIRATDNGSPPRTASVNVSVSVAEVNLAPTLGNLAAQTINEGLLFTFQATASDPDQPANALSFSLEPGAPLGAAIDPVSGTFTWSPAESQAPGQVNIGIRVSDNGTPALSDSKSFSVTINEVNDPPLIAQLQAQSVQELSLFSITATATDPDSPPSPISFSFDVAPAGAAINPASGVITWTPTELQGPSDAIFVVKATETSPPNLSQTMTFSVAVTEKNESPTLAVIPNQIVTEGEALALTAVASDTDVPAQSLTFSLDAGAPAGAVVHPVTGAFAWQVDPDFGAGTVPITVRVTDNGPGALSAARTFNVQVQPTFHGVINEIMYQPSAPGAQFIELHNNSSRTAVDLTGLRLTGTALTFDFSNGTVIQPRGFLLLVSDLAGFNNAYPGAGGTIAGTWSGTLNTSGDTIRLIQPGATPAQDLVLDSVTFRADSPWPTAANGGGPSLQLTDPKRDNDRVGNWAATPFYSGFLELVSWTHPWRYYQDGPLTGSAWTQPGFVDVAWLEGNAGLYVETAAMPVPMITPLALGQWSYYFRARFNLPVVPTGAQLALSHVIDDGAVFYLNGAELTRFNMPAGSIVPTTPSTNTVSDATIGGPFNLSAGGLVSGENVLSVEVHQATAGSSDIVMASLLELQGGTVANYTPGTTNNVSTALPEFATLRINEVLPSNVTGIADGFGDRESWIEIVNTGDFPVSLDGHFLSDDPFDLTRWAFPPGYTVPAHGFLIIFADGETFETGPAEIHTSFRLQSAIGWPWFTALSRIQNGQPAVVDFLQGIVEGDDAAGGRVPDGDPSSSISLSEPTPGAPNSGPVNLILASIVLNGLGQPVITWQATPGTDYRIEYKSDLDDAWATLATVPATGTTAAFTDQTAATSTQRFYRIVKL